MSRRRLDRFVEAALAAGRSHAEIDDALARAGWSERDRRRALAEWSDSGFPVPVPRPARGPAGSEAVLYLFLFGLLGALAVEVTLMLRALVDVYFLTEVAAAQDHSDPVAAEGYIYESALRTFRWGAAALVVLGPVLAWLVVVDRRRLRAAPAERTAPARTVPALVVVALAGISFLGSAMTIVYQFLTGEPQMAALLKLSAVAVVAAATFAAVLLGFRPRG